MNRAWLVTGGAGLLVGIAAGYVLSGVLAEPVPAGSTAAERAASEVAANALARLSRLQQEHVALRAELESLREQSEDRTAVEGLMLRTGSDPSAGAGAAEMLEMSAGVEPTISFGAWANEPALRNADWVDMGIRARDVVRARGAGIGGRQPVAMGALEKKAIRELHGHLDRMEARRPELGGHPVVVVNLMASHLAQAGMPLLPWQIDAIESKGRQYEVQAEQLRADMSRSDVLPTEKKLGSIRLRKSVVDEIVGEVLTREQWDVLFDPETKGLLYYDIYQVGGLELERPNSSVYWRNVRADAVEHLRLFLLTEWELPREAVQQLDGLVEQWIDAIMRLPRFKGHPSSALHIDEVLPCVEVHIEFQKRVIEALAGQPDKVEAVRSNVVYAIFPQLRG